MTILDVFRRALAPAVLALVCSSAFAQEAPRQYKFDKSNRDLSKGEFTGLDQSDTNFQNSVLFLAGFRDATLQRCNFQAADLTSATLNDADLTDSDMRSATFENANLQGATLTRVNLFGTSLKDCGLQQAKFDGADLRNSRGFGDVTRANFSRADLRGADLSKAYTYGVKPIFTGAKYDRRTRWPAFIDPETTGAELKEEPSTVVHTPKPASPTTPPTPSPMSTPGPMPSPMSTPGPMPTPGVPAVAADDPAKQFAALDLNADDVLSGKEARPYAGFDLNQDGEITKSEFIAGRSKPAKP